MCNQKWLLILKTACSTPWFQWILIFLTLLHVKSDSDDEEDRQIEEILYKNRMDIPIDVDFSDVTGYKDSGNYDGDDTDGSSDSDASAFKTRRQSMMSSTGTFQGDMRLDINILILLSSMLYMIQSSAQGILL